MSSHQPSQQWSTMVNNGKQWSKKVNNSQHIQPLILSVWFKKYGRDPAPCGAAPLEYRCKALELARACIEQSSTKHSSKYVRMCQDVVRMCQDVSGCGQMASMWLALSISVGLVIEPLLRMLFQMRLSAVIVDHRWTRRSNGDGDAMDAPRVFDRERSFKSLWRPRRPMEWSSSPPVQGVVVRTDLCNKTWWKEISNGNPQG
jgi:hypothetical protein